MRRLIRHLRERLWWWLGLARCHGLLWEVGGGGGGAGYGRYTRSQRNGRGSWAILYAEAALPSSALLALAGILLDFWSA